MLRRENDGHSIMHLGKQSIAGGRDDRKNCALSRLPGSARFPTGPPGPSDTGRRAPQQGLPVFAELFPFVEAVEREKAAAPVERLTEDRLRFDPLCLGIDVREPNLDVFRPEGHEPPAHDVEAALPGLGIVADHGEILGRRGIPIGWNVGGRALRPDREDEFDLADIGGETGTATYRR